MFWAPGQRPADRVHVGLVQRYCSCAQVYLSWTFTSVHFVVSYACTSFMSDGEYNLPHAVTIPLP